MGKNLLGDFFEENYNALKYYLKGRFQSLNEYDVEDIVQHTITKLLFKGDKMLNVNNLPSYVYTSLSNGAKDYFKKNSRLVLEAEPTEGSTGALEEIVLAGELKEVIENAINNLDEKSRYVFVETEIKGRSYDELIEETGEKLGTLLSRKSRAKKKLQIILEDYVRRS